MRKARVRARDHWLGLALFAITTACGGGGGGGGPSTSFAFTLTGGSVAEGAAPLSMTVVLSTSQVALAAPASVDVIDAGTGTAAPGSDYAAFAPVNVLFPIGAVDGDSQVVPFAALDDQLVEGADETVRFALANAVGGAPKGIKAFTATVTDIHFATLQFSAASSLTPDESSAPRSVGVRLDLPPGTALGVAASVRVTDAGGGSASSGADYSALAPVIVSFPAGSADGATQNVDVQVIDDLLVESDESVDLALSQPGAGSLVGAGASHEMVIQDDDGSAAPALIPTEGPTGIENGLAYDSLIGLGTQAVGAGPSAGTLVRIANAGGSAMELGAPRVTGSHPNDFDVTVDEAPLEPAPAAGEAGFSLAPDELLPMAMVEGSSGPGFQLRLDPERLARLSALPRVTLHGLPVPGLGNVTLDLDRLPSPIAPGAVLRVDGLDVPGGLAGLVGELSLWGGTVLEHSGSKAFVAFSREGVRGFLELPFAQDRFVHLVTERAADGTPRLCRVVRGPEFAHMGFEEPASFCGGEREVPGAEPDLHVDAQSLVPPGTGSLTSADCRLAIETDYQLYQKFGSTLGTSTYVTQLIAAVSNQYFTDVQTTLSIAYLGIHSSALDPWTSQDSGGNASNLLDEFRNAWLSQGWPVQANLAHFISGANLGGGVAYVNVLCNQGFGFGVSGNISGNIDWGAWNGAPGNFTWDFVVVAHELGHNFGSSHTHAYCPPLDQCSTNCNTATVCSQGTIMSYCHTCGGMDNIDLEFHPVCANIMRQAVNSSCLGESALGAGDYVQYRVRFRPMTTTGVRSANLEISHDAPNQTQPFRLRLQGTAN